MVAYTETDIRNIHRRIGWDELDTLTWWRKLTRGMYLWRVIGPLQAVCAEDGQAWPCRTIRLLDK